MSYLYSEVTGIGVIIIKQGRFSKRRVFILKLEVNKTK